MIPHVSYSLPTLGPLPALFVGQLRALQTLRLNDNLFTGPIPAALAYLTDLTDLQLADNRFKSNIGATVNIIETLPKLEVCCFQFYNRWYIYKIYIFKQCKWFQITQSSLPDQYITGCPQWLPVGRSC